MRSRALALVALAALVGNAPADMFKPGKGDQVKLGKQASAEIRKKEKVIPESDERLRLMRDISKRLLATVDDSKEPWQYSFDLIDNKEVNAFALPGGPIYFYTGLVNKFKTEDHFAAVLAHELVHVRREHWAYAYADSQKRGLGLSLLLILTRANRTTWDLASLGNSVVFDLPYSRRHETEADVQGLDMMIKAGYNPEAMAEVFVMLSETGGRRKPDEWLSTHPDDGKRVARIREEIRKRNGTWPAMRPLPWKPESFTARNLRWNW